MLVDGHCHVSPVWFEPVETLLDQMSRAGVSQAVLIQLLGQTHNRYQQECVQRFPERFASVVWVDPINPEAVSELRTLAGDGASGVRLRPSARSPGGDPLAIWRCAQDCGIAVSCVGTSAAFSSAEFVQLIAELPSLVIVLEHFGGTSQPDQDEAAKAQRLKVVELARFPNVYLKIPGLGELMPRKLPPPASGRPFDGATPGILQTAMVAFGPRRLMWGSDFPVVCSREGYGNSLTLLRDACRTVPSADLDEIFGNVARRVFKLPAPGAPP